MSQKRFHELLMVLGPWKSLFCGLEMMGKGAPTLEMDADGSDQVASAPVPAAFCSGHLPLASYERLFLDPRVGSQLSTSQPWAGAVSPEFYAAQCVRISKDY